MRPKITSERLAALAVALAPLVYFFPALAGAVVLAPDDGVLFNVPLRVAAAREILGGALPLWNPYVFSGMPLHAAAQAGTLFPLNWTYLVFSPPAATNLMMFLTYALAGAGAFHYARRAGASLAGACVTALVWEFCGVMVGHVGHTNLVQTGALLPWVLWAVDGRGEGGTRWRGLAVSVLVALTTFVGHSQTFAYTLLLACAYAITCAFASEGRAQRRRYLSSLAFVAAGVVLAAVQLLPTRELLAHSLRSEATYEFFTSFSMAPEFLWAFVAPYVVGGGDGRLFRAPYTGEAFYLEYVGYAGLLTLMLAALAVALRRDARTLFWAAVVVVGLSLASGKYFPLGLYKLVYHVPLLNLFRVPARHLFEVDFALAVLAGRGLTTLTHLRGRKLARTAALACGAGAVLLAWAAVTVGRPADFRLGRQAPATFLRAPELFVPVVVAALSAWALWAYARGRGRQAPATLLLFAVLVFDLALWGQFSGWRRAPGAGDLPWRAPEAAAVVSAHAAESGAAPYRILTVPQSFTPGASSPFASDAGAGLSMLELQPNTYMMHGLETAAGYDGFGLARYSRLAGDMKLWGELPDPARSLAGVGREFDLLNVRYLVARNPATDDETAGAAKDETTAKADAPPASSPPTPARFGGHAFAAEDLGVSTLDRGERLVFTSPRVAAERVALLTSLSWSADVADGVEVGRVRLRAEDGRTFEFALRAGEHTSEWAYDRADVRARARHRRAPVATSFTVEDARGRYEGHTYVAAFDLPERATITGGEIEVARLDAAPDLGLDVKRLSLADGARAFPLGRELLTKAAPRTAPAQTTSGGEGGDAGQRWRLVGEAGRAVVYENTRALPRAWLAPEIVGLPDDAALQAIRAGRLPDGRAFDPRRTALADTTQKIDGVGAGGGNDTGAEDVGEARVTHHGPSRVEVAVSTGAPAVLVLSENFYPGWRAEVDGRAADVLRVDYNLRGVRVPSGRHEVRFVYRPRSVLWGALVSLLTLAALFAWCLRGRAGHTLRTKGDEPEAARPAA